MGDHQELAAASERVEAVMAELRSELASRGHHFEQIKLRALEQTLTEARRKAIVSAHWGIVPVWPMFGDFEVLVKRAMRIVLRWYINPIVEQQNEFNLAIVASLYDIEAQCKELYRLIDQYNAMVDQETSN